MNLRSDLSATFSDAFESEGVPASFGDVVVSQRPELADFQCNGALAAAKAAGRNPRDLAQTVTDRIGVGGVIAELSVAGPGFINITVTGTPSPNRCRPWPMTIDSVCRRPIPPRRS